MKGLVSHDKTHELAEWMNIIKCDHECCELYDMRIRDIEQHTDAPDYGEDQFREGDR